MKKTETDWNCQTKRNTLNLGIWTGSWVITMAVVAFGPKFLWDYDPVFSSIGIILNFLVGIGMILANKKHLSSLDEMQRKIHLEAMGISLGLAVVSGLSYSMLDVVNLINYDAEISHVVIIIGITYLVGVIIGNLRYK